MSGNVQTFEAGDVVTQSGITLKGAKIVYATYGTLAPDKSRSEEHTSELQSH